MWRKAPKEKEEELIRQSVLFMTDSKSFGAAMERVVVRWTVACEQNLSNINSNRRAWLGQAANCIDKQIPEHITRQAWALITEKKRTAGNKKADKYILIWEKKQRNKSVGKQLLLW